MSVSPNLSASRIQQGRLETKDEHSPPTLGHAIDRQRFARGVSRCHCKPETAGTLKGNSSSHRPPNRPTFNRIPTFYINLASLQLIKVNFYLNIGCDVHIFFLFFTKDSKVLLCLDPHVTLCRATPTLCLCPKV